MPLKSTGECRSSIEPDSAGSTSESAGENHNVVVPLGAVVPPGEQVVPLPLDVIFGRGQFHACRIGNIRFHAIIEFFMPRYNVASSKREKSRVVNDIYNAVREVGRFLKIERGSTGYIEADEAMGKEKIGQAIRYKQRKAGKDSKKKAPPGKPPPPTTTAAAASSSLPSPTEKDHSRDLQNHITASIASSHEAIAAAAAAAAFAAAEPAAQGKTEQKIQNASESSSYTNTGEEAGGTTTAASDDQFTAMVHEPYRQVCGQEQNSLTSPYEALLIASMTTPQDVAASVSSTMILPPAAPPTSATSIPSFPQAPSTAKAPPVNASLKHDNDEEEEEEKGEIISDEDLLCVLGTPEEYERAEQLRNQQQQHPP